MLKDAAWGSDHSGRGSARCAGTAKTIEQPEAAAVLLLPRRCARSGRRWEEKRESRRLSLDAMRTVCVFGLASCVILRWLGRAPQVSKTAGISFEQSADNVFDFQVDTETYNRVYYNTSEDGETLVKVVFHNEADPSTQSCRLHLAQAVLPSDTSASTTQDGANHLLQGQPRTGWSNVVNFASDEALSGTLPVVQETSISPPPSSMMPSSGLDRVEGIHTTNDVDATSQFGEAFDKSTPCGAEPLRLCPLRVRRQVRFRGLWSTSSP